MKQEFISKHIRFTETHIDILDDLIKKSPGLTNYSEAVRFIVSSFENNGSENAASNDVKRKINSMAKNIDILTEMVAGGFHSQDVRAIGKAEETYIYEDALKTVEGEIQRATTIKANSKPLNTGKQYSTNFK